MLLTKNKHRIAKGIALVVLWNFNGAFAQEPINLAIVKDSLVQYHDSGQYEKDISQVVNSALSYLKHHMYQVKKPAIVLDIDETALSNFPAMQELSFGGTLEDIQRRENEGNDPVIKPVLKLYYFARRHRIATFFISSRPEHERQSTIRNLRQAGYTAWEGLILKPTAYTKQSAVKFKSAMRKKVVDQGYQIILNIGDQSSDLAGGYAMRSYKLPNPYYLIN